MRMLSGEINLGGQISLRRLVWSGVESDGIFLRGVSQCNPSCVFSVTRRMVDDMLH